MYTLELLDKLDYNSDIYPCMNYRCKKIHKIEGLRDYIIVFIIYSMTNFKKLRANIQKKIY